MNTVQIVQLTLTGVAVVLFGLGSATSHEKDGAHIGAGLLFLTLALAIEMYFRFAA